MECMHTVCDEVLPYSDGIAQLLLAAEMQSSKHGEGGMGN